MKRFYYEVGAFQFSDTVAFGEAWKEAKAKATELHGPIYREVVKDGNTIREEVYLNCGVFVGVNYADKNSIKFF